MRLMPRADRVRVWAKLQKTAAIRKDAVLPGTGSFFGLWGAHTDASEEAEQIKGEMPDVFKDFLF